MQQADNIQRVATVAAIYHRVARLFAGPRLKTPQPEPVVANIEWHDSDSEQTHGERDNRPVSGGYNEAFIVQYWASYHTS